MILGSYDLVSNEAVRIGGPEDVVIYLDTRREPILFECIMHPRDGKSFGLSSMQYVLNLGSYAATLFVDDDFGRTKRARAGTSERTECRSCDAGRAV